MSRHIGWPLAIRSLVQTVAFVCAMAMAIFVGLSWGIVIGLFALSAEAIAVTICGRSSIRSLIVSWSSTLVVWGIVLSELQNFYTFEEYYFVIVWLVAVGILIAGQRISDFARRSHWRVIGLVWGFLVSCTWLFGTYLVNRPLGFHLAVLGTLTVLIAAKRFFHLSGFTIQLV